MRFGGMIAYSKSDVTELVPESYLPKSVFLDSTITESEVLKLLEEKEMVFPLIIKPDMGERGKGVKVLRTLKELVASISKLNEPMLLQTYEDLKMELGILYARNPVEEKGRITSIVVKDFPVVVGDGKRNMLQLILGNLRTRLSYKVHVKRFADSLEQVPLDGDKIRMVNIGNHMLGTTFFDGNHLNSPELETVFDQLAKHIEGFYIGRFDLRANSLDDLLKGDFKVIEVNGVNSEPCHIYDPEMPLWKGIRDLLIHWRRVYEISVANHKTGVPYASFSEIRAEIKRHNKEGAKHD